MMIDGKGVLLLLVIIAVIGFIIGAIVSIWVGPIAMLYGAVGLPVGLVILFVLLIIIKR